VLSISGSCDYTSVTFTVVLGDYNMNWSCSEGSFVQAVNFDAEAGNDTDSTTPAPATSAPEGQA